MEDELLPLDAAAKTDAAAADDDDETGREGGLDAMEERPAEGEEEDRSEPSSLNYVAC